MISMTVLRFLLVLIGSFVFGLLFYYLMAPDDRKIKKQQMDQITSLAINLIIYIWIGKIIVNFSVFMQDPFAILAYPSDRRALYIALIFTGIHFIYRHFVKKQQLLMQEDAIVPTLIATLFMYEVLQIIVEKSYYYFLYVILYMILLIMYAMLQKYEWKIMRYIVYTWFGAQIILSLYIGSIRFFQYIVSPIFIIVLFIIYTGYTIWQRKIE